MIKTHPTTWHGLDAWTLENDGMKAVVVPQVGAKIVSLYDKRIGHEWLVPSWRALQPLTYGARFVDQDMSGWDEMFPTIDACDYPDQGVYLGRRLPDHGEVWALPWALMHHQDGEVTLAVSGAVLPYQLQRTASLQEQNVITLDYSLKNNGDAPFFYLWTAHPQFAVEADTLIQLPSNVTRVVNVLESSRWGAPDKIYAWPEAIALDGKTYRLDKIGPASRQEYRKFYLLPEHSVNWAALVNHRLGCSIRLDWSAEQLPYLGIWVDEGAFNPLATAALEPSNGYYDSLSRAFHNRRISKIQPGEIVHWSLRLSLLAVT